MAVIEPDARVVPNPRAVFRKLAEGSGGVAGFVLAAGADAVGAGVDVPQAIRPSVPRRIIARFMAAYSSETSGRLEGA